MPNLTITKLGDGGKVCLFSIVATDLVADVSGFFPAGSGYTPITNPTRILDTRNGTGTGGTPGTPGTPGVPPVSASGTCRFQVADIPTNVAFCDQFETAGRQSGHPDG